MKERSRSSKGQSREGHRMNIIFSLLLDFRLFFFFFSSLSFFLSFESMLKLSPLLLKIKSQAKPSLPESFAAAKEGFLLSRTKGQDGKKEERSWEKEKKQNNELTRLVNESKEVVSKELYYTGQIKRLSLIEALRMTA